ncbi:MAG: hypothetical protein JO209_09765 [Acidisphaera sp.]|nr:hypothetical protein [Acidisphaera sp.]
MQLCKLAAMAVVVIAGAYAVQHVTAVLTILFAGGAAPATLVSAQAPWSIAARLL